MNNRLRNSAIGLMTGAAVTLTAFGAAAQDTGAQDSDIRALLSIRTDDTPMSAPEEFEGFASLDACLDLAWTFSNSSRSTRIYFDSKEVIVSCDRNGEFLGARICADGECSALLPPSVSARPE